MEKRDSLKSPRGRLGSEGVHSLCVGRGTEGDGRGHSSRLKYSGDNAKETDLLCLGKGAGRTIGKV